MSDGPRRCVAWAREVGLSPAGTAPKCDVFVLVDHPLPWPRDLGDDPLLAGLEQVAVGTAGRGRHVRLQAVAVEADQAVRRVLVFDAGEAPFHGYGRSEGIGYPDDLPGLVATLVGSGPCRPSSVEVSDLLVCTHGSRDTCCGSMGTRLWMELEHTSAVQVRRTSHSGGHRFAPTAVTFPDGNYWAHMDTASMDGVVRRSLDPQRAAQHLRGCAAFSPPVQVADRAVLADRGWSWLDCARHADHTPNDHVAISFEDPIGRRGVYDIVLAPGRTMPVPDCGADPALATKTQDELRVVRLRMRAT